MENPGDILDFIHVLYINPAVNSSLILEKPRFANPNRGFYYLFLDNSSIKGSIFNFSASLRAFPFAK
jgi:hypothetical protein